MRFIKSIPVVMVVLTLAATSANAAIIVDATSSAAKNTYLGTGATVTFLASAFSGFNLSSSDKLVVVLGSEVASATNGFNSATYNGQTMNLVVQKGTAQNFPTAAIFYLDNPGAAGDLVLNVSGMRGLAASVYALSGTTTGVGASNGATTNSVSLTTLNDNSLVIAGAMYSGSPIPTASNLTAGPGISYLYSSANKSLGTSYETVATAGSFTPTFDHGGVSVAAEFAPVIPEPATLAIGVVGLMMVLPRRRTR
ncbi:MAG: hypothetical protein GC164_14395 [Phycisphaera sp.]|nr:hypothetical protein [Phycisphaera sp.]